jgi:hypothetical protein
MGPWAYSVGTAAPNQSNNTNTNNTINKNTIVQDKLGSGSM